MAGIEIRRGPVRVGEIEVNQISVAGNLTDAFVIRVFIGDHRASVRRIEKWTII